MRALMRSWTAGVGVAVLVALAAPVGCSDDRRSSRDDSGSVGLALQVAPGVALATATYTIGGPGGFGRSGAIDVAGSATISALIGGIPAGRGYSISITAASRDAQLTCAGAVTFDVTAQATTQVTVHLTCHEGAHTGSVLVNGTINICPALDGVSANPAEVIVGNPLALSAAAHDRDLGPAPLTYRWTATGGTLDDATSPRPTFTCQSPGTAIVTVTVADGDPAPGCPASLSLNILCTTPSAAPNSDSVLGFETTAGWKASAARTSTHLRTEGAAALALADPAEGMDLTSLPVDNHAAALAGIADPASSIAVDLRVTPALDAPHNTPNTPPGRLGSLDLLITSPSRGLIEASVGTVELGARAGLFRTVKFPVSALVRAALADASYDDLVFRFKMHPAGATAGSWIFDNLRVHAPSTPPAGATAPVDLTATHAAPPAAGQAAVADFALGPLQVPQNLHLRRGGAGTGSATLEIGLAGQPFTTCTFTGSVDGNDYVLAGCTGSYQAGDLVAADWARLTIVSGDAQAGPIKVRAQLALTPVGDVVGDDVIPPMPTFWGDEPDEASQILTGYVDRIAARPVTEHVSVRSPVPDYALRLGDSTPVDNLNGAPPPADDPPFDISSHLNRGGKWDAYWRLAGNLGASNTMDRHTTHFEANFSANVVIWGHDKTVANLTTSVDTDNGEVSPEGFATPGARGSLHMFLFGTEIPGGGSADPSVGFNFDVGTSRDFDLPPFYFWVFKITAGVTASAGVEAAGALSFGGFGLSVTPHASVGAHLSGQIGVPGIISGGLDVRIDLIAVSAPVAASASWLVSTEPDVCSGALSFALVGHATISSGGGEVDLVADFGPCPVCVTYRHPFFHWKALAAKTFPLFNTSASKTLFPLPPSLCRIPLQVTIAQPTAGMSIPAGVPFQLSGHAIRPPTAGASFLIVDCADLSWQTGVPSDSGLSAGGCNPWVTFNLPGPRHLSLLARDSFAETGTATVDFDVGPAPSAPTPFITSPVNGQTFQLNGGPVLVHLEGGVVGGSAPASALVWLATPKATGIDELVGIGPSATWTMTAPGDYKISLLIGDAGVTYSTTVTINGFNLR